MGATWAEFELGKELVKVHLLDELQIWVISVYCLYLHSVDRLFRLDFWKFKYAGNVLIFTLINSKLDIGRYHVWRKIESIGDRSRKFFQSKYRWCLEFSVLFWKERKKRDLISNYVISRARRSFLSFCSIKIYQNIPF